MIVLGRKYPFLSDLRLSRNTLSHHATLLLFYVVLSEYDHTEESIYTSVGVMAFSQYLILSYHFAHVCVLFYITIPSTAIGTPQKSAVTQMSL
jgi:hypothetical protein